jgi:hypothetical protein
LLELGSEYGRSYEIERIFTRVIAI